MSDEPRVIDRGEGLVISKDQARLALEWNEISMERMGDDDSRLTDEDRAFVRALRGFVGDPSDD